MPPIDVDADTKCCVGAIPGLWDTAQAGLREVLQSMADDSEVTDVRWVACMMATVRHECANRWQPSEEFGRKKNRPSGVPATVQDADGTTYSKVYYGRPGYVQLAWRYNYQKAGQALGLGNALVLHPDHALEPVTAYRIMPYGCALGCFYRQEADRLHQCHAMLLLECPAHYQRRRQGGHHPGVCEQFEQLLNVPLVTASSAAT